MPPIKAWKQRPRDRRRADMNAIDLIDRTAIVTGGSGGIGRAIVARLRASGARVAVLDRATTDAGGKGANVFRPCDVTNPRDVDAAVQSVTRTLGRADILVNNAGVLGPVARLTEVPLAAWRQVVDINLTGALVCCQAIVPGMIAAGYGRIVNMSSVQAKEGMALAGPYAASKAGLIALTKTLGKELAQTGVLANCVTPTAVSAGMFDEIDAERRSDILARIPMGRFCTADEVASMVAWLSSAECSFSTGAVFDLSGGRASY
jgi:NAD(P)-dependent dehydrogenase (short-subunit alcohol dehydrogenase family)